MDFLALTVEGMDEVVLVVKSLFEDCFAVAEVVFLFLFLYPHCRFFLCCLLAGCFFATAVSALSFSSALLLPLFERDEVVDMSVKHDISSSVVFSSFLYTVCLLFVRPFFTLLLLLPLIGVSLLLLLLFAVCMMDGGRSIGAEPLANDCLNNGDGMPDDEDEEDEDFASPL